jgi:uncharacterized membrane protein
MLFLYLKVYCNALLRLPALVRQWWGDLEPKVATLVEQVTSVHCAPLVCAEEIKVIQAKDMHHGNMLVMKATLLSTKCPMALNSKHRDHVRSQMDVIVYFIFSVTLI